MLTSSVTVLFKKSKYTYATSIRLIRRIDDSSLKQGGVGKKPAPLEVVIKTKESRGSVKQQGLAIS